MKLLVEVVNHVHRRELLIRITNQNDFFFSYIYLIDSTGFDRYGHLLLVYF